MRRGCAVLMMCLCLLLGGCGGRSQGVSPAIAFRASLVQAGGCSFRAELTADYGDYVVPFALDCETEVNGPTHFTVAAPETLAGITAAVDETGGTVTYDGLMMDFGLLANGRLAPAAGPAVVAYCWSSAYLAAGGEAEKLVTVPTLEAAQDLLEGELTEGDTVLFLNDLPDIYS